MNCKLLAIWTSVILILWILLLYIVNMEKINKIKEDFINTSARVLVKQFSTIMIVKI